MSSTCVHLMTCPSYRDTQRCSHNRQLSKTKSDCIQGIPQVQAFREPQGRSKNRRGSLRVASYQAIQTVAGQSLDTLPRKSTCPQDSQRKPLVERAASSIPPQKRLLKSTRYVTGSPSAFPTKDSQVRPKRLYHSRRHDRCPKRFRRCSRRSR